MTSIVMRSIGDIEMAHELAKVAEDSLQLQMPMIQHQHKTVQLDSVCFNWLRKNIQESKAIHIIAENCFSFIPSRLVTW